MKLNPKDILRPTLVLFVICLVVTGGLAFTNKATKDQVALINKQTESDTQKRVLSTADSFGAKQSFGDGSENNYVVAKQGSEVVGYVFTTSSKSYGGAIKVMTGIDKTGKVTGVELLSTNDTPGLGLNAQKSEFRDQYKKAIPSSGEFTVTKSGETGDDKINALTGATITSKAVTSAVNDAIKEFNTVKGGA